MKKIIALLLALVMLFALAACSGKKTTEPSEESPGGSGETLGVEWSTNTQEIIPFDFSCTVNGVARLGNNLLLYGETKPEEDETGAAERITGPSGPVLGLVSYSVESDGGIRISGTQMLSLDEPDAIDEGRIYGIAAGGDGSFYVLTGEEPGIVLNRDGSIDTNENYEGRYSILRYSANGEFLTRMKISGWGEKTVAGIAVGGEGEIAVYGSAYVSVLDRNGNKLNTEYAGDGSYVQSVSPSGKGLIASFHETSTSAGTYYLIDGQSGLFSELEIPGEYKIYTVDMGNWGVTQGLHGEFIVCYTAGVYGYQSFYEMDFDKDTCDEIFPWNPAQNYRECTYACRLTEAAFAYTSYNRDILYIVTAETHEKTEESERSVVRVTVYGDGKLFCAPVETMLDRYNAASTKYVYEYERFETGARDRLNTVLGTKDAPDLVLFHNGHNISTGSLADVYLTTDSDYFEDLYPYIDADPELSRESFLPNLLNAISFDGKLTQVWPNVEILTIAARTSDVGDGMGLTAADYSAMVDNSDKYASVFYYGLAKETLLAYLSSVAVSTYVDRARAACSFDSDSFAELLQWVNEEGSDIFERRASDGSLPDDWPYDWPEVLLYFQHIQNLNAAGSAADVLGAPYTYVGIPHGQGSDSLYISSGVCMAIPALGGNKEGAWEFIRNQLMADRQLKPSGLTVSNIPVIYEDLRRLAAAELEHEDREQLLQLLQNTRIATNYSDEPLRDIMMSCGQAYLAGDKSLEETVALIQSRASVYMAEKYG